MCAVCDKRTATLVVCNTFMCAICVSGALAHAQVNALKTYIFSWKFINNFQTFFSASLVRNETRVSRETKLPQYFISCFSYLPDLDRDI